MSSSESTPNEKTQLIHDKNNFSQGNYYLPSSSSALSSSSSPPPSKRNQEVEETSSMTLSKKHKLEDAKKDEEFPMRNSNPMESTTIPPPENTQKINSTFTANPNSCSTGNSAGTPHSTFTNMAFNPVTNMPILPEIAASRVPFPLDPHLFQVMVDSAPVIVWITGVDTNLVWVNRNWLEFTGKPMEEQVHLAYSLNTHLVIGGTWLDKLYSSG